MEGRALQDVLKVHCFGCGSLNAQGLQIKSHVEGNEVVCRWQPPPDHIGHPGIVYGGTIASIIDCHAMWTWNANHMTQGYYDGELQLLSMVVASGNWWSTA